MRRIADTITGAIRAAMGGSVEDVGTRPADVRDPWEGWPGPDPFPRRRKWKTQWGKKAAHRD